MNDGSAGAPSRVAEETGGHLLRRGHMSTERHKLHEMRVCVSLKQSHVPTTGHNTCHIWTYSEWGWAFNNFYKLTFVQKLVMLDGSESRMRESGRNFIPSVFSVANTIDYNIFSQSSSWDTRLKMCSAKIWLPNQVSLKYCIPQPLSRVPIHINLWRRLFSFSVKKHV